MTTLLKILAALVSFLASVFFARALGADSYGLYVFVSAWVALITIVASLGLPQYLVREGARDHESLPQLRTQADRMLLVSGLACMLLMGGIFISLGASPTGMLFLIAAPLPLLTNMSIVRQSLLQAVGRISRSLWPLLLLVPLATLGIFSAFWIARESASEVYLMLATVFASLIGLAAASFQLRHVTGVKSPPLISTISVRNTLPFMLIGGMYLLVSRTDLIMLGLLRVPSEVGVYAIAARAADLLVFVGMAVVTAAAPSFARLHKEGQLDKLQRLLRLMGRRLALLTVPAALTMILFAEELISWFYGPEYINGATVLQVLAAAQLVSVLGGPLGTLLNMTGHEKAHLWGVGLGLTVNIALNAALIPPYGARGAALATCISIIASRILLIVLVRNRLRLRPTAIGI